MKNILNKINIYRKSQKGMTLVELLVVMAIITILSGIAIFDYTTFRSSIAVENLANDVALSIRKAQGKAIGVKSIGSNFNYPQGIHFSTEEYDSSNPYAGSEKSIILFTDIDENGYYDDSGDECEGECQEKLTIDSQAKISGFYKDNMGKQSGTMSVLFSRPNPDAYFCYSKNNTCSDKSYAHRSVIIEISNGLEGDKEIKRFVTVWSTGQISFIRDYEYVELPS